MGSKNKVEVRIRGKDYTIVGVESEEYIQRIALYVDKKMEKVLDANTKLSTSMAAVLTAINVADEYFKEAQQSKALTKQIDAYNNELEEANQQLKQYQDENQILKEIIQDLKIELAKKETELEDFIANFDYAAKNNMLKMEATRKKRAK